MSYILDALKRAESERERGAVPGLHSQSLHPSVARAQTPSLGQLSALLLVLALLVGLWLWWSQAEPLAEPLAAKPAPAPTQVLVASPPSSAAPTLSVRQRNEPAPIPASAPRVAVPARSTPVHAAVAPAPPLQPSAATSSSASASPLPEGIPAQLVGKIPALRITGAVYASDPKQRLLLVNNLVLHQGEQVTPELTLEAIEAKAAVFNYQGTRFRLPQ